MKQINYFKFLEIFPEFINMDDSNDVKLTILRHLRKRYWRKKEGDKPQLLPLSTKNMVKDIQYYIDKGYVNYNYKITFRGEILYNLSLLAPYPSVHFFPVPFTGGSWADLQNNGHDRRYLSQDEITNLKRTILIDNMLK